MSIALYDISITSYLQILGGVSGFLDKGYEHCSEARIELDEIIETRLFHDMLPFRFQIISVAHHSLGAVKGIEGGLFKPPTSMEHLDYDGLRKLVSDTTKELKSWTAERANALEGKDVLFKIGDREIPFIAENFIMSFSLPNLYFHAATAYDILRMKGVPLGKRDFMGNLRFKGS